MAYAYRVLDDIAVADLAFEADGDSVEDLFRGATQALIEAMANPVTVRGTWERTIRRVESDTAALLFDWLSDLVYWKDAAGVVYREVQLTLTRQADEWELQATLLGAPVDPSTQELRADVKGVTKHLYDVGQRGSRWYARVVLDI
jgi:SHS2 domain-containing protein